MHMIMSVRNSPTRRVPLSTEGASGAPYNESWATSTRHGYTELRRSCCILADVGARAPPNELPPRPKS